MNTPFIPIDVSYFCGMKYRMLTDEELQHLEGDLKAFLIINGIEGDRWKELNESEPEKAVALVELFSDNVLQTVYEKVRFLEFRSPDLCLVFHCKPDNMELISISRVPGTACDLSTPESIHEALVYHAYGLTWFRTSKPYNETRELEIHRLLEQGSVLSTPEFWEALEKGLEG